MTEQINAPAVEAGDDIEAARQYVHQLRVFRTHAVVCAASLALIIAVNLSTNMAAGIAGDWSAWWSMWAAIGWAIGLTVHGLVVRGARPGVETSTWEARQMRALLATDTTGVSR